MVEHYDAIVIGSGLGGLTAGAMFAHVGKRVLLLERNASFGGAAATGGRATGGMTVTGAGSCEQRGYPSRHPTADGACGRPADF